MWAALLCALPQEIPEPWQTVMGLVDSSARHWYCPLALSSSVRTYSNKVVNARCTQRRSFVKTAFITVFKYPRYPGAFTYHLCGPCMNNDQNTIASLWSFSNTVMFPSPQQEHYILLGRPAASPVLFNCQGPRQPADTKGLEIRQDSSLPRSTGLGLMVARIFFFFFKVILTLLSNVLQLLNPGNSLKRNKTTLWRAGGNHVSILKSRLIFRRPGIRKHTQGKTSLVPSHFLVTRF